MCARISVVPHTPAVWVLGRLTRHRDETSDTPGASVSISITGSVLLFHFHSISDAIASHTECTRMLPLQHPCALTTTPTTLWLCVCVPAIQVFWLTWPPRSCRFILPCFTLLFGMVIRAGGHIIQARLLLPPLHMAVLFIYIPQISFQCFASMVGRKLFVCLKLPPVSLIWHHTDQCVISYCISIGWFICISRCGCTVDGHPRFLTVRIFSQDLFARPWRWSSHSATEIHCFRAKTKDTVTRLSQWLSLSRSVEKNVTTVSRTGWTVHQHLKKSSFDDNKYVKGKKRHFTWIEICFFTFFICFLKYWP